MEESLAPELRSDLAPPAPSGAPLPATFIRTFPDDTAVVKVGGTPDLVPHTPAEPPKPPVPEHPTAFGKASQPRSAKQQSWGTAIAIIIIVVMVVVGAFYAWGKRVAEQYNYPATAQ